MSNKSSIISKIGHKFKTPVPREAKEIEKQYAETVKKVADAQYVAWINTREVEDLNHKLLALSKEFVARKELDKKNAPKLETQEVANDIKQ